MDRLNVFVPISKIDVAQRLVYGIATAEAPDRSGEICDYATTKPYYEKWSGDISKSTDGKSLGNLRAMHGKVAAGKVTSIAFNDDAKQIEICAKVVDDNEWKKVEEGVYTGFSQGGGYVKRWKDADDDTKTRYTAQPSEISLVDLPCLPGATFSAVKADGATELRKFITVAESVVITNDQVAAKATELAKAAGNAASWADHIPAARAELEKAAAAPVVPVEALAVVEAPVVAGTVEKAASAPAVVVDKAAATPRNPDEDEEQVWLCKRDGKTFKTKAELRKHIDALDAQTVAKAASVGALGSLAVLKSALGVPTETGMEPAAFVKITLKDRSGLEKSALVTADALAKGLYIVSRFASIIDDLNYCIDSCAYEAQYEADGSQVPSQMKAGMVQLCTALIAMVAEETSELISNSSVANAVDVMEMAAGTLPVGHMDALVKLANENPAFEKCRAEIEKVGARNSKADASRIQKAHDAIVEAGAACTDIEKHAHGDLTKAADDLSKVTAERDALQKAFGGMQVQLDEVIKGVQANREETARLAAQPVPLPIARVVEKSADGGRAAGGGSTPESLLATLVEQVGPQGLADMMIKHAQSQPQKMIAR